MCAFQRQTGSLYLLIPQVITAEAQERSGRVDHVCKQTSVLDRIPAEC